MRNTQNTAMGKIVLSLVFAFLVLISGVSACGCNSDYKTNSCSYCYEAVYPNGVAIAVNSFGVFTLSHAMYNVSQIAVTWGDAYTGCMGRIETSNVNSVWQDIATRETQKFYFSTASMINLTSVKVAVVPKSSCATCYFARVYKVEVWGKCGGACYNCSNGNQTNTTDGVAPIVNINSPIANQVYNYSSIMFDFNATDNGTIDKIWYNLSGVGGFYNGVFSSNLSEGNYSLTVYANDSAGNVGLNSLFFSINLSSGDNGNQTNFTAPLIYINSPHNFSGNSSAFVINSTSDQNIASWSYSLNGGALTTFMPSFTVLYAINGTNSLFVSGTNANGTGNASTIFYYNYSNQSGGENGLNQTNISAPVISNISTNPILPVINNGTNETIVVNFSSNVYPIVVIFKLLNSGSVLVNNQSYVLLNSSSLPLVYVIPANLSNGIYYLWLNATNAIGNSSEYLVGNFTVNISSGNNGGDNGNHNGGGSSHGNDYDDAISFSDSGESISLDYSQGNATEGYLLSGSSDKSDSFWLTISMILVILCLIVFLLIVLLKRN